MYGKLQVGQPAMIINTHLPEHRWLIGSVVMIEAIIKVGENAGRFFHLPVGISLGDSKQDGAYVSNCRTTGQTRDGRYQMLAGHACFDPKNLMPLPPLEEKTLAKEKELELA